MPRFTKNLYWKIRVKFGFGPAYHMTHVNNLNAILNEKAILAKNFLDEGSFIDISNLDVQLRRQGKILPNGRNLHDYVPL